MEETDKSDMDNSDMTLYGLTLFLYVDDLIDDLEDLFDERHGRCEKEADVGKLQYHFKNKARRALGPLQPFVVEGVIGALGDIALQNLVSNAADVTSSVASLGANLNSTLQMVKVSIAGVHRKCLCEDGVVKWSEAESYNKDLSGKVGDAIYDFSSQEDCPYSYTSKTGWKVPEIMLDLY